MRRDPHAVVSHDSSGRTRRRHFIRRVRTLLSPTAIDPAGDVAAPERRPGINARQRLAVAVVVGLVFGALHLSIPFNDMKWPLCYARQLLRGADPYAPVCQLTEFGLPMPANPLTTGLVALPFAAAFNDEVATAVMLGLSYALLTWALLGRIGWGGLLVLVSYPSSQTEVFAQWAPLLLAVALLPALLPLTLIKPHIGLPIAATRMTRRRGVGCVLFAAVTFLIDPRWPLRWFPLIWSYGGYIPFLTMPGALLLLGLWRWRANLADPDVRYLILCACVPQKDADALILAALFHTPREVLFWTVSSWGLFVSGHLPIAPDSIGIRTPWAAPAFLYLPAAAMVLSRHRSAMG